MPELTDKQIEKLETSCDAIIELSAVVLGVKGKGGLVQDLEEVRLEIKQMTLKTQDGEKDVAKILNDVVAMKPMIEEIRTTIYHPETGLCSRVDSTERKQEDNRKLIFAMWTFTGILIVALITLLIKHVGG